MEVEGTTLSDESETNESDFDKYLEKADLGSQEAKKVLEYIKRTYTDPEFKERYWTIKGIRFVKNENLVKNFQTFKAELQSSGRKPGSGNNILVFSNESKRVVGEICRDGARTVLKKGNVLGHTGSGVHLVHHYDILTRYMIVKQGNVPNFIVVYKAVVGKTKPMVPRTHHGGDIVKPYPGFDCHVSARRVEAKMPIEEAYKCSQIYFYEYNKSALRKFPRQILPYAVIEVEKKYPVHVEIPMLAFGSKVNLWEVKGETRRGFRFVLKSPESKMESQTKQRKRKIENLKSSLQEQLLEMRTKRPDSNNETTIQNLETSSDDVEKKNSVSTDISSVNKQTDGDSKPCKDDNDENHVGEKSDDGNVLYKEVGKESKPGNEMSDKTYFELPNSMKPFVTLRRLSSNTEHKSFEGNYEKSVVYQEVNITERESEHSTIMTSYSNESLDQSINSAMETSQNTDTDPPTSNENDKSTELKFKEKDRHGDSLQDPIGLRKPFIDTRQVLESFKMLSEQDIGKLCKRQETLKTQNLLHKQTDNHKSDEKSEPLFNPNPNPGCIHLNKQSSQSSLSENCNDESKNDKPTATIDIKTDNSSQNENGSSKKQKHVLSRRIPQSFESTNTSFFKTFLKSIPRPVSEANTHLKDIMRQKSVSREQQTQAPKNAMKHIQLKKYRQHNHDQNTSMFKAFLPRASPLAMSKLDAVKGNDILENKMVIQNKNDWSIPVSKNNNSHTGERLSPIAADSAPSCLNYIPFVAESQSNEKHFSSTKSTINSPVINLDFMKEIDVVKTNNVNNENKKKTNRQEANKHELNNQQSISENDANGTVETSPTKKANPNFVENHRNTSFPIQHCEGKTISQDTNSLSVDESTAKRVQQILRGNLKNLHKMNKRTRNETNTQYMSIQQKHSVTENNCTAEDNSSQKCELTRNIECKSTTYPLKSSVEPSVFDDSIAHSTAKENECETYNEIEINENNTLNLKADTGSLNGNSITRINKSEEQTSNNSETSKHISDENVDQKHFANARHLSKSQCKSAIIQTLNELSDVLQFLNNTENTSESIESNKHLNTIANTAELNYPSKNDSVCTGKTFVCKKEPSDPEIDCRHKSKATKNCKADNNLGTDFNLPSKRLIVKRELVNEILCENETIHELQTLDSNKKSSETNSIVTDCTKNRETTHKGNSIIRRETSDIRPNTHIGTLSSLPILFDVAEGPDISELEIFGIVKDKSQMHTTLTRRSLPHVFDIAEGPDILKLESFGNTRSSVKHTNGVKQVVETNKSRLKENDIKENTENKNQTSKIPTITSLSRPIPVLISSKSQPTRKNLIQSKDKSCFEKSHSLDHAPSLRNIVVVPIEETNEKDGVCYIENEKLESVFKPQNEDNNRTNDEIPQNISQINSIKENPNKSQTNLNISQIKERKISDLDESHEELGKNNENQNNTSIATCPKENSNTENEMKSLDTDGQGTTTAQTSKKSIFSFNEVMKLKFQQFKRYRQGLSYNKFIDYNKVRRDRRRNALRNRNKRIRQKEAKTNATKKVETTDVTKIKVEACELKDFESSNQVTVTPDGGIEDIRSTNTHNLINSNVSTQIRSKTAKSVEKEKAPGKKYKRRRPNRKHKDSSKDAGAGFFLWKNKYGRHFGRQSRRDCDRKKYLEEYDEWKRFQEREELREKIEIAIGEYRKTYDDKDKGRSDSKVASYLKYLTAKIDRMESKKQKLDNFGKNDQRMSRSESCSSRRRERRRSNEKQITQPNAIVSKEGTGKIKLVLPDNNPKKANTKDVSRLSETNGTKETNLETMLQALIAERFVNLTETLKEQLSRELIDGTRASRPKSTCSSFDNLSTSSKEVNNAFRGNDKSSSNLQLEDTRASDLHDNVNFIPYKHQIGRFQENEHDILCRSSNRHDDRQRDIEQTRINSISKQRCTSPSYHDCHEQYMGKPYEMARNPNSTYRDSKSDFDSTQRVVYRKDRLYDDYGEGRLESEKSGDVEFYDGRHDAAREREERYCDDSNDFIQRKRQTTEFYNTDRRYRYDDFVVRESNASLHDSHNSRYSRCYDCNEYTDNCVCYDRNYDRLNDMSRTTSRPDDDFRSQYSQNEGRSRSYSDDYRCDRGYSPEEFTDERQKEDYRSDNFSHRRRSSDFRQQRYQDSEREYYRDETFHDQDSPSRPINCYSRTDEYSSGKYRYSNENSDNENNYYRNSYNNEHGGVKRSYGYSSKPRNYSSRTYYNNFRKNSDHRFYSSKKYDQKESDDSYSHEHHSAYKRSRLSSKEHYYQRKDQPKHKHNEEYDNNEDRYSKSYKGTVKKHFQRTSESRSRSKSSEIKQKETTESDDIYDDVVRNISRIKDDVNSTKADHDKTKQDDKTIKINDVDTKQPGVDSHKTTVQNNSSDDYSTKKPKKRSYFPPSRSVSRGDVSTKSQLEPGEILG